MVNQLNTSPEKAIKQNNTSLKIILGVVAVFVILCGLVALGIIYYVYGRPYFEPKTQIVLEPDTSQVSTVDPADLKAAAEILTARCHAMGVSSCSFVATENNQIIGRVPDSVNVETVVKPAIAIGLLEFVDFGKTPVEIGTIVQTDFDYPYFPQADGTVWHTIMTNDGFKSVDVTADQVVGKPAISFMLTDEGAKIFADFTASNIGRYLGITLDKVVVSAPIVNSPITGGSGIIQGSFTAEEANALAVYLRTKGPLPLPLIIREIVKNSN